MRPSIVTRLAGLAALAISTSGCLLVTSPPRDLIPPSCDRDKDCPSGYVCGWFDDRCELKCDSSSCDDGFGCDTGYNNCADRCDEEIACQASYYCCTWDQHDQTGCTEGECLEK